LKYKVLIVEDNDDINQLIYNLIKDEYDAVQAFSGTEALRIWNDRDTQPIDIILLDLMLPGKSGEEIISEIRKTSSVPIIVITAKGDTSSLVNVLELGADDYISKPFKTVELMARMKANIRRIGRNISSGSISHDQKIEIGGISIDPYTKSVFAAGGPIDLTQKEFELLYNLMLEPDRVFTKEILFSTVWQDPGYVDENTINVHISRLRNKVKNVSGIDPVRTIWGIGLKFYAE